MYKRQYGNDIVYRSNTVGTDTVKFSDGTTKEITIDETMAEIDLSGEGWNLQLDSYGPDDSPENLDENGELIDPTAHKITTLNYANIALIPWTSLDVSEDDLKAVSYTQLDVYKRQCIHRGKLCSTASGSSRSK